MQHKLLAENGGQRTFAVILETGEEVLQSLSSFVNEHDILSAQFTAIGAFSEVALKYFDWKTKNIWRIG